MATMQGKETFGRARLSFAQEADVDEFVSMLARFEAGEIGPDEWRAFRLLRGTYGQRQTSDAQMMRVKIPQGVVDAQQLEVLAGVGERYSRGFGHITTRQNVQFHFVKLHDAELAMRELAAAGITTREACGNSVRNITACPYAGVAPDEPFDVTPYAESLTRYLLRHPLSSSLPRKFKIAFEGCADDHVGVGINDIGWHARVRVVDGAPVHGFRVTVAGGTATMVRAGLELHEFLPADQMFDCAEAIIRVFHRLGDYKHKQRNRLKFLVKALGWDSLPGRVREGADRAADARDAGAAVRSRRAAGRSGAAGVVTRPARARPDRPPRHRDDGDRPGHRAEGRAAASACRPIEYRHWAKTNVRPQKQSGYSIVIVATLLGDLTSAQMRLLGDLASSYGDGTVRVTVDQNLVFRWVRNEDVEPFYRSLAAAGLSRPGAGTLSDVTSCPGAESCKLAVTQSRGLGRVFADHLLERQDLVALAPGLDIKISGCPNGCGQHHIAGLGFQGSMKKVGGQPAPHYMVMVGGGVARRHHDVRPPGGQGSGAPGRRSAGAAAAALSGEAHRGRVGGRLLPPRRAAGRQGGARRSRAAGARAGIAAGLHRSRGSQPVQPGSDGRRVQRLATRGR